MKAPIHQTKQLDREFKNPGRMTAGLIKIGRVLRKPVLRFEWASHAHVFRLNGT